MRRWWLWLGVVVAGLAACSDSEETAGGSGTGTTTGTPAGTAAGTPSGTASGGEPLVNACEVLGLPELAMDTSDPFGILRHDRADDFTLPLRDGGEWQLSAAWSGCESYVFIPSGLVSSGLDDTSLWARDVDELIAISPRNVHYFFVATRAPDTTVAELDALQVLVDSALAPLDAETQDWWRERLHLVASHRSEIQGWVGDVLNGIGRDGFAIDRQQRIRLVGSLSDVNRYSSTLNNAGQWPFEGNMAYASYEARHYNYEAEREIYLAAQSDVTVITPWDGEVLAEEVTTTVDFPDAATMATFDTFEIDLTVHCPDPTGGETFNCGEWDYLSHIHVLDSDGVTWLELARFITTYSRAGRYLVDATPMLVLLQGGGARELRFTVSPPWNPQAYLTRMDLRLSNQGKASSPSEATALFSGGNFNTTYNDAYQPIDVAIPAGAQKVELWAIITGHGAENFNCAEFCNHQHEFTVNGVSHTKVHDEAQANEGCIGQIDHGMVPNQGGTWWFGRGGWCPGQQVEPWVVDVTADVTPGQTATVSYQGLRDGNPPPTSGGNIIMTSYLVVYE